MAKRLEREKCQKQLLADINQILHMTEAINTPLRERSGVSEEVKEIIESMK